MTTTPKIDRAALPALTGSDKQIAFGNDERARWIDGIDADLPRFAAKLSPSQSDAMVALMQETVANFEDAAFWIREGGSMQGLLKKAWGAGAQAKVNEVMAK